MYRTRTVPGEKEEFDQDKKDYAAFFPLLLGSIWGPGARGAVRGEDKAEAGAGAGTGAGAGLQGRRHHP